MGLSCPGCVVDSTRYNIDGTGVCGSESIIAGKVVFFKERVEGYNIFVDHKEHDAVVAGVALRSNVTTTVNEEDGYSDYKEGDAINILTRGVVWCVTQTIESPPEHGDLVYVNNDGFVAKSDGDEIVDGWIFTGDFYKFDETINIVGVRITPLHHRKYLLTGAIIEAENGYIEVDDSGNILISDDNEDIYLGSVFPDYNLAWRNDFTFKGIHLGILFSGRIGGICYSATQANMDLYGVSEASAAARDAGGVLINGREMMDAQKWYQAIGAQSGLPQYYTYSATNFRLQELSLGYTLPRKWFKDKLGLTVSLVGKNLWMIWCKAPFDPEAVATTGLNYQGIDYFMMPSTRNLGFNVKFEF